MAFALIPTRLSVAAFRFRDAATPFVCWTADASDSEFWKGTPTADERPLGGVLSGVVRHTRLPVVIVSSRRLLAGQTGGAYAAAGGEVRTVAARQALVVGASSGIGAATAAALAATGYDLALWGRDESRLRAAAQGCRDAGGQSTYASLDVTDTAAVRDALDAVLSRGPLAVVVWAAGVFDWASAEEADSDTWRQLLNVNLTAAAVVTALVLPAVVDAAPSALVYIGSGASRQVFANNAAYVASKHGLAGLAGATFLDVRDRGVKVSLVSPGLVAAGAGLLSDAGRTRPQELLTPQDVAAAVRFVVTFPGTGCPTEIRLDPQRTP